jgi:arginine utilization protein RocB
MGTNVFKLNEVGEYQIVGYVKSDKEINGETEKKIAEKYSVSEELKLLRLNDRASAEFIAYNDYVENCRTEGKTKKANAALERTALQEIEINNGEMSVKIMV